MLDQHAVRGLACGAVGKDHISVVGAGLAPERTGISSFPHGLERMLLM